MPAVSQKQFKFLAVNKPEVLKKWKEEHGRTDMSKLPVRKKSKHGEGLKEDVRQALRNIMMKKKGK